MPRTPIEFDRQAGLTLLELLIAVAVLAVVSSLAVAGLLNARRSASEAATASALRTIYTAQTSYAASCGGGFYASSLPILGSAPAGTTPFVSPDLSAATTVTKSGYAITLARGSDSETADKSGCNPLSTATDLVTTYFVVADPAGGTLGVGRHFWMGPPGVIFIDPDEPIAHTLGNEPPPAQALDSGPAATPGTPALKR